MISDYESRKKDALKSCERMEELVSALRSYAEKNGQTDPIATSEALLKDIRSKAGRVKEGKFNIMIAGESKSGKSTFINAYLGVELLPMDVKQCTSSIVEIRYGESFLMRATYADDRKEEITSEEKARGFLKANAALDDDYREIPVPTINSEILVKYGRLAREKRKQISIPKDVIEDMLNAREVKAANIYNLPDYNERIKEYINKRKDCWYDIVTKIEIIYPFGENLHGIEIIDSPGVCARGGVAEITSNYIQNADAIIFLKPVSGQSLESTEFSQFLENVSVNRNKGTLFLVLTRIATMNDQDLRRLEEEAYKQFSSKIDREKILFVDSKAELYAEHFSNPNIKDDIQAELQRLNKEGSLDDFVLRTYWDTNGLLGKSDDADFIEKLREKSRFEQINNALDRFGRTAHYRLLFDLLDAISKLYGKLRTDLGDNIKMFRQKAEDPKELERQIANVKHEMEELKRKMYDGVKIIMRRYSGSEGIIASTGDKEAEDFEETVDKIDDADDDAFDQLEKASLQKIDLFKELSESIPKQVVTECDKELVDLSDKSQIHFESLKPDFTEETFKEIKEEAKSKATETKYYEEGTTFKKTRKRSVYSQKKHFNLIKSNILNRIDNIKNDLIDNLEYCVTNIERIYKNELKRNIDARKDEMDAIMYKKASAEQIQEIIKVLSVTRDNIDAAKTEADKIKGGIEKNV